jgi:hypothetical protein
MGREVFFVVFDGLGTARAHLGCEAFLVEGSFPPARRGDLDDDPDLAEQLVRDDDLLGPEAGRSNCPVFQDQVIRPCDDHQQPAHNSLAFRRFTASP